MKKILKSYFKLSFLALLGIFQSAFAQEDALPGGVTNPYIWIKAETIAKTSYLKNVLNNSDVLYFQESENLFNYNPSVILDANQDSLKISLNKEATDLN